MKKIAILGATGYIGRSLVPFFINEDHQYETHLFSRDPKIVGDFYRKHKICIGSTMHLHDYDAFEKLDFDVIINCTGVGNIDNYTDTLIDILDITEKFDNLIISYLALHPDALYINLSSGAVYGDAQNVPANDSTITCIPVNEVSPASVYTHAKIYAEVRHRALSELRIVDLRVFAFFSRYVDTDSNFLMSQIAACLKSGKTLVTDDLDITRDFIIQRDLFSLICCLIDNRASNSFFDVVSVSPVTKFVLLEVLASEFGLKYEIVPRAKGQDHSRVVYYSESEKAKTIGFEPTFSSLTGISYELRAMLENNKAD